MRIFLKKKLISKKMKKKNVDGRKSSLGILCEGRKGGN